MHVDHAAAVGSYAASPDFTQAAIGLFGPDARLIHSLISGDSNAGEINIESEDSHLSDSKRLDAICDALLLLFSVGHGHAQPPNRRAY